MPENLKIGGERPQETPNQLKTLTELSDKFDPKAAKRRQEADRPKKTIGSSPDAVETHHVGKAELLVDLEDLSPKDAANEYLSLLDELSQDFTNPFYKNGAEHGGKQHLASGIVKDLGRKYSDNPHYRHRGYSGTEADERDYTVERMEVADMILAHEIGWREEGEKGKKAIEKADREMADLDAEYSKKSKLSKIFGKKKYEKARTKLEYSKHSSDLPSLRHNERIAKELAISYNSRGNYDYDYENRDFGQTQNEARNRRFFGLDDPKRFEKVERAIALRKKFESEWKKEK